MDKPHTTPIIVSNSTIILAFFLCVIICILGLLTAFRQCLRRSSVPELSMVNSGHEKVIDSLPKLKYKEKLVTGSPENESDSPECVICLSEFVVGDKIRVLPRCSHTFHAACVDTWLRLNASCPSCRRNLASSRCQCNGDLIAVQPVPYFLP